MVFFNFFKFFPIFLEFSIMRRVGTEWNRTIIFISLFFCQFQHIMAWNETTMVFWNFLNFIAIFLEFSITRQVGMKRNDNFCSPSFSAFSNLFWVKMKQQWYFLIFLNFLLFFWNFHLCVRFEQNATERLFLFSLFFSLVQHIMAWNETTMVFWNFLNFIAIFLEFSITLQVRTKRNDNFCFSSFLTFSSLFFLKN